MLIKPEDTMFNHELDFETPSQISTYEGLMGPNFNST